MKSVFDILNDINYAKPKDYQLTPSDDFNAFMIQRWLSMIDISYLALMNEVYNTRHKGFKDDQQLYDFLKLLLPKKRIGKLDYIKAQKIATPKIKDSTQDLIELMASTMEVSQREIEEILKRFPELIKEYKEEELHYKK